ncbi:MAG: hypothetical protein EA353_00450 [Puniceicoccaceae bacterium]|nr:MAG: hypothetical protein EA353_00450 [Puniceicoccaceae bacterium]
MKKFSLLLLLGSTAFSLNIHGQELESSDSMFSGVLYSRIGVGYEKATSYHAGSNSFASAVFANNNGEYTFFSQSLDLVYATRSGLYIASGLYSSAAEVKTDGLGLGVPNTDSGIRLREIPLALGFDTMLNDVGLRFEARYIFNVDDDFDRPLSEALSNAVILPVTDGADSLTLSARGRKDILGTENSLLLGYQIYESDVSHPLFPRFSLGNRLIIDYEIAKVFGDLRLSLGHLYSNSRQTKGDPSPITGTAYLTEKPRFSEVRVGAMYRFTSGFFLDGGVRYIYDGSDAPKQRTFFVGGAVLF